MKLNEIPKRLTFCTKCYLIHPPQTRKCLKCRGRLEVYIAKKWMKYLNRNQRGKGNKKGIKWHSTRK